jgi:uncharacterized protein YdeI (YjbR/CyaY-like superfamily)
VKPVFFASGLQFRQWLEQHRAQGKELLVGFYNQRSDRGGLTYAEALDEALCFGWIDGLRKRRDENSYTIRFTPRKPGSIWSLINVGHVKRLTKAGKMQPAGLAAFKRRDPKKTGIYSFENRPQAFTPELAQAFRDNPQAWAHWEEQPPGYRRTATWCVMSAKREETRQRRMAHLIALAAQGRRLELLSNKSKTASKRTDPS